MACNKIVIKTPVNKTVIKTPLTKVIVKSDGTQGAQGTPGSGSEESFIAGASIGGQRVVITMSDGKVYPADASVLSNSNTIVGITKTAVSIGSAVDVIKIGSLSDPSFSFTADLPIYVDTSGSGVITQVPPASPSEFSQALGHAISTTKIFIQIEKPTLI